MKLLLKKEKSHHLTFYQKLLYPQLTNSNHSPTETSNDKHENSQNK